MMELLNGKLIPVPVGSLDWIEDVARRACRIAYKNDRRAGFVFNGIPVQVGPLDEPEDVVSRYHRDYDLAEKERGRDDDSE